MKFCLRGPSDNPVWTLILKFYSKNLKESGVNVKELFFKGNKNNLINWTYRPDLKPSSNKFHQNSISCMAPTYTNFLHHKVSFSTSVTDVNVKNVSSDRTEPNAHDGVHSLLSIKPIASCIQLGASVYVGAVHKSSSQVSLIHVCCLHSLGCSLSLALSTLSFLCVFSRVYAG